jgi:hypothetical protein
MNWVDIECAKLPTWESTVPWLYLDNARKPNATTAQGFLVASLAESLKLPWKNSDGTTRATPAEVTADWNRVTAMRGGMMAERYKAPSSLLLAEADIEALTRSFVENLYGPIKALFPGFDAFPLTAQVAVSDMFYNPGAGVLRSTYRLFCAAGRASPPDFKTMAAQCARNAWMPAFVKRNAWTAQQFLLAV